ncbi:hypothetical protein CAPTEDRAFT_218233 [Capitella teleta]|uniref:Neurotransmitter-gated ion-channel ligand-binding domain-containing protein n=1 Tax=Capitella teleta TaxID=283909 RepID=R7V3V9_CAPTE|nr:hypothetical protein CAPTEDRAFT_218233 [Capitella teleta]|eukprot:ELU13538.1 hypothetical protein CAPTEDRAFT_218233 [Capitella teleta]
MYSADAINTTETPNVVPKSNSAAVKLAHLENLVTECRGCTPLIFIMFRPIKAVGIYLVPVALLLISSIRGDDLERMLHDKLLTNYNTNVRPVLNHSHSVDVKLKLTVRSIIDLDGEMQVLTMYNGVNYKWYDEYLRWNASDYGEIESIRFRADQIWHPDIQLFNNMDKSNDAIDTLVYAYSDGRVYHTSHMVTKSNCAEDVGNFPYDTQTCKLTFGSWTYHQHEISLGILAPVDLNGYVPSGEFEITNATGVVHRTIFECCPDVAYTVVTYTLELKRRTDHATHFIMSPCIICSLLIPFIFLLPHGTNDKILYGIGQLIANVLVFGEFEAIVPHAYPRVPTKGLKSYSSPDQYKVTNTVKFSFLGILFMVNLVLTGLALVFTVATIGVWKRSQKKKPVPGFLRTVFLGICGRVCFVHCDDFLLDVEADSQSPLEESNGSTERDAERAGKLTAAAEWCQLAAILDRMLFVLFSVLVIITAIAQ